MKEHFGILGILLIFALCACQNDKNSAETPVPHNDDVLYLVDEYDENRDAAQDLSQAVEAAKGAGKKIILEVGGDWCPDCIALERFINDNEDIFREMANQYFIVKINLSPDNMNEEFLGQYPGFEWVPHFFILKSDGTLIESLDTRELMTDGAFDPQKFWSFLE